MSRYIDLGFIKIDTDQALDTFCAVGLLYGTYKLGEIKGELNDAYNSDIKGEGSKSKEEVELEVKN